LCRSRGLLLIRGLFSRAFVRSVRGSEYFFACRVVIVTI
jgi:hypothetical protein